MVKGLMGMSYLGGGAVDIELYRELRKMVDSWSDQARVNFIEFLDRKIVEAEKEEEEKDEKVIGS